MKYFYCALIGVTVYIILGVFFGYKKTINEKCLNCGSERTLTQWAWQTEPVEENVIFSKDYEKLQDKENHQFEWVRRSEIMDTNLPLINLLGGRKEISSK